MSTFDRAGLTLSYEDLGGARDRTVVFLHGLLLSAEMMQPVARLMADSFRPVLLDLSGHGRSSRPVDAGAYQMGEFARDTIALLDHLGVERAALFGTSLGANVALEVMLDAPSRVVGAVLEMPVLDRGSRLVRRAGPVVERLLRQRPGARVLDTVARRIPELRPVPGLKEVLAMLARYPAAGAAVVEQIVADAGHVRWAEIDRCRVPALVIGHPWDPLHPVRDAAEFARRIPNGRLVTVRSIVETHRHPERLARVAELFFEGCFRDAERSAVDPAAAS